MQYNDNIKQTSAFCCYESLHDINIVVDNVIEHVASELYIKKHD
jgi:hypothetical protein